MADQVVAGPAGSASRIGAGPCVGGGLFWAAAFLAPGAGLFASVSWAAFLVSAVLLLVGAGLAQLRQADQAGVLSWLGYVLTAWALLVAAGALAWFGPGGMWVAAYAFFMLLPLGALAFAVATLAAGTFPRAAASLIAVGALGLPLNIVWNEDRIWATALSALFGLGWARLGLELRSARPGRTEAGS